MNSNGVDSCLILTHHVQSAVLSTKLGQNHAKSAVLKQTIWHGIIRYHGY
jgi:hypothetical protein